MKLVEITYTMTKKILVEVPSCLGDPEIGQLATQHLDPYDVADEGAPSVTVTKAAGPHPEGSYLGVVVEGENLRITEGRDRVRTDDEFEDLTGRAAPPNPKQVGMFGRGDP